MKFDRMLHKHWAKGRTCLFPLGTVWARMNARAGEAPGEDTGHRFHRLTAGVQVSRRSTLLYWALGACGLAAGCGGGSTADSADGTSPATGSSGGSTAEAWRIDPVRFESGGGGSFDLATTLPASIPRGGRFGVHPDGTALPAGMQLAASGILSVGSATVGDVTGVIFTYEWPPGA